MLHCNTVDRPQSILYSFAAPRRVARDILRLWIPSVMPKSPADSIGTSLTGWNATVGTAVALQWLVILALAGVAGILGGWKAALSLLLGGAAVAVPNAVLALWLTLRVRRTGTLGAISMTGAMLGGELLKLGLTLALLVIVIAGLKQQATWLALIVGVIAALKAQWLALWFTRRY
jgi:F0F1-type ATP synthase assembly protein I